MENTADLIWDSADPDDADMIMCCGTYEECMNNSYKATLHGKCRFFLIMRVWLYFEK